MAIRSGVQSPRTRGTFACKGVRVLARGVLFIHSCPPEVAAHLEWALARVFSTSVALAWEDQSAMPGSLRAEAAWEGEPGTASEIASALLNLEGVRFEVTEDPGPGSEGERFSATPDLGLFRASIGPHGDVVVHEDRLRTLAALINQESQYSISFVAQQIESLIGAPWDLELEPFRMASEPADARLLHDAG